jgi:hypothetical protein
VDCRKRRVLHYECICFTEMSKQVAAVLKTCESSLSTATASIAPVPSCAVRFDRFARPICAFLPQMSPFRCIAMLLLFACHHGQRSVVGEQVRLTFQLNVKSQIEAIQFEQLITKHKPREWTLMNDQQVQKCLQHDRFTFDFNQAIESCSNPSPLFHISFAGPTLDEKTQLLTFLFARLLFSVSDDFEQIKANISNLQKYVLFQDCPIRTFHAFESLF